MRISHITKTTYGGSGQYALRLSNALNSIGHASTLCVSEGKVSEGVSSLSTINDSSWCLANRGLVSLLRKLSKAPYHSGFRLERWKHSDTPTDFPDAIHIHGLTGWIGFNGLRALLPLGIPVFWTAHDLWMISGGCVVYQGCDRYQTGCTTCPILKPIASRWSQQEWKHKAKFIADHQVIPIANSQWMADKIKRSPFFAHIQPTDISIVPPIVNPIFFQGNSFPSLRTELNISPERTVLGLSARALTDHYKGIPEFLNRFASDDDLVKDCTVLLCGDGEIELPSKIDARCLGAVTDPKELARFYSACDVFISPSRMETFGMALLEAQAARTVVVSSRVGGTPEAVYKQQHRYLSKVGDDLDLLSKLKDLLSTPECLTSLGSESSKWVKARFSAAAIAEHQARIYREHIYSYPLSLAISH